MESKRLFRSKKNRMFLGVLGGMAEYLDVDPALVRLIFVVLLVFQPVAMALLYFLAALVIPEEGEGEKPVEERLNDVTKEMERVISGGEKNDLIKAVAIILILLGVLYLVAFAIPLFFIFRVPLFSKLAALLLLAIGIILLLRGG
ncbi:PspC domain-containing protein [Thermococcus waiotapuensis]|uniref:PspC domain-containing protein n=1 Tax=Thermococcus waiotapuensis TaxID=90909 RepID=A0AAE4NX02_9EURY|nr:PspC domain-containing protein [Thermococcus waiotapuensis]MDV3104764.1 PspC domain-containing protein [Thermococcus waiotapuensis]